MCEKDCLPSCTHVSFPSVEQLVRRRRSSATASMRGGTVMSSRRFWRLGNYTAGLPRRIRWPGNHTRLDFDYANGKFKRHLVKVTWEKSHRPCVIWRNSFSVVSTMAIVSIKTSMAARLVYEMYSWQSGLHWKLQSFPCTLLLLGKSLRMFNISLDRIFFFVNRSKASCMKTLD